MGGASTVMRGTIMMEICYVMLAENAGWCGVCVKGTVGASKVGDPWQGC